MMGSMINSLASFLLSMIVTRVTGEVVAGVFVYAFALAQQMQSIGSYEVRPYQSTDINEKYPFSVYLSARIVTCALMMIISTVFILIKRDSLYNSIVIFLMCLYRMVDSAEDVYQGMFQQKGRLDIAGKAWFFRVFTSTVAFIVTLYLTQDLIITTLVAIIVAFLGLFLLNINVAKKFVSLKPDFHLKPLCSLLLSCLPLFLGVFLLLYIYNAPKYVIDQTLAPEYLTYYNALFMPTFVINLFSGFVLKPMLNSLADSWYHGKFSQLKSTIIKMSAGIMGFTLFLVVCAYFLGIPVLSWFYSVDLSPYRSELLILLIGGGFSAISVVFYYAATVMREQKSILAVYAITALIAVISTPYMIKTMGLWGASLIYLLLMVFMTLLFAVIDIYYIRKAQKGVG
jgi:O-antigen/teichoic acid export membrane protein